MRLTLLAWAGRISCLGASGLTNFSAALARVKNPSAESSPVRATEPKPPPTSQRNSRRVRPQNCRPSMEGPRSGDRRWSVQVNELVGVQQQQAVLAERLVVGQL